jgi:hypothetical protein
VYFSEVVAASRVVKGARVNARAENQRAVVAVQNCGQQRPVANEFLLGAVLYQFVQIIPFERAV